MKNFDGHFDCDELWAAEARRLNCPPEIVEVARSRHVLAEVTDDAYYAGFVACGCGVIPGWPERHVAKALRQALEGPETAPDCTESVKWRFRGGVDPRQPKRHGGAA